MDFIYFWQVQRLPIDKSLLAFAYKRAFSEDSVFSFHCSWSCQAQLKKDRPPFSPEPPSPPFQPPVWHFNYAIYTSFKKNC